MSTIVSERDTVAETTPEVEPDLTPSTGPDPLPDLAARAAAASTMTAAQLNTADLDPISLAELVERAELLTRVDRKYVLPATAAAGLVAGIADHSRVLEIGERRTFGYRSTYFDTAERDSFLSAGRGHRRRWKVRTRLYVDTDTSFLEVKTRVARDQSRKDRIEQPDAEMVPGGLTFEGREFVAYQIGVELAARIEPVLITDYRRTTLFLPDSESRVTIDMDLGWSSLRPADLRVDSVLRRPALAIVETKTGSTPSLMDRLLWRAGHRPVRISKYGVGMAALNPNLPRLKWHRAMTKNLGLPTAA